MIMTKAEIQTLTNKHAMFTNMLFELIKSLLNSSETKYHVIEKRTKTIESLEEKIIRKEISNIQDEITDITGLRIILYYQDDVDKIINLIKDNFIIDLKNSTNKADLYSSNEFGYLSIHYIITLDDKRNKLPEWETYSKLKAEIQIRTVLQHSWASISHELTYKKDYEIPKELQRKLFRLAGLFELADEQFLKIRDEHDSLKKTIEKISQSKEIESEKINLLTLGFSFKKTNSIYLNIEDIALNAGFLTRKKNVPDEKYLSEIILASDMLGLSKIIEIEDILNSNIEKLKLYFKLLISNSKTTWHGDIGFFNLLAILYLLNDQQLNEFREKTSWSPDIFQSVTQAIHSIKKL